MDFYYFTALSNFAKGYDKYSRTYSKANIPQSTFPNEFYLLQNNIEVGLVKARKLLEKTVIGDKVIILRTKVDPAELHVKENQFNYIKRNWIEVTGIYDDQFAEMQIESAYAESLSLNQLLSWDKVKPRSLSILPIANYCQAKCQFCFSHSSVSEDQKQGHVGNLEAFCIKSKNEGAGRFVITGGGEPTLLSHNKLLNIISTAKKHFKNIIMITNGFKLGNSSEQQRLSCLNDYKDAGLTVLSISRHSIINSDIMGIDTKSELIARDWKDDVLKLRWVCVLQKQGVHNESTLKTYLDWVATGGVKEICFKELYVATSVESEYYNSEYNKWSEDNQVPMSLVLNFLKNNKANKISELPWGAPIYNLNWKGYNVKIAVYTEPSVFWERSNGICRSWNLMADGTCYANLETKSSKIELE